MSNEITMPKLSDTMEEGKIIRWLKRAGDSIRHGEAIAEVETDKADMVMESFDEGVIEEIRLPEGQSAHVGAVIATFRKSGDQPGASAEREEPVTAIPTSREEEDEEPATAIPTAREPEQPARYQPQSESFGEVARERQPSSDSEGDRANGLATPPQFHPALSGHPSAAPTGIAMPPPRLVQPEQRPAVRQIESGDASKVKASPLARRAAEEAGLDLSAVRGTGPDNRVTKRDIDNFLREQQMFRFRRLIAPREGAPGTREELTAMRKTIANRMAISKREIPHFYVTIEVDMEEAVRFKNSLEAVELFDEDISYNDIIIKATALALSRFTRMNAAFENEGISIYPHINIGVAVAVEDGLIVPVIHGCERKALPEIARSAHRLVSKAAQGGFTAEELSGGTFTISNMGMLGIEHFSAVIVPGQAAILAVSAIKDRPVVRNGQITIGKTMMVTVSCDHRVIDGVVAGRFLQDLKRFLENPASLLV
ncbi:MAG: 2-oxo acid dehydrogenase subunit E2 [Candidatus Binataceae bacterium]|nr:2-oxo acid dehydrogenase subunit E2 [Candidatus Binataceae bacterium]